VAGVRRAPAALKRREGELVAGKYKLERLLGEGGMGVVYAARHTGTGRRVAIKCVSANANSLTANARFLREAQAAGRIDHPNVVQVFDVGEDERGRFIVMEFLQGQSLAELWHERRLPAQDVIDLMMPALRGVHAAHRRGVVHRDLKPDNIFVCRSDAGMPVHVKVLDFGVSKLMLDEEQGEDLTRTGVLLGTPQYMSPERVRGRGDTDLRTDVYALGVILYEGLTGRRPFDDDKVTSLVVRIAKETAPPLRELNPSIPAALEAVVLKAMARDPDRRFADAEQLALALEPFAGEERFAPQKRDPTGRQSLPGPHASSCPPVQRVAPATQTRRISRSPSLTIRWSLALGAIVIAGAVLVGRTWPRDPSVRPEVEGKLTSLPSARPAVARAAAGESVRVATPVASQQGIPDRAPVTAQSASERAPENPTAAAHRASAANDPPRTTRESVRRTQPPRSVAKPRAMTGNARAPAPRDRAHPVIEEAPHAPQPRVARGVRTGGLSEQDF
jgi:eukaryotic-like serine/threonine-protein kinase